MTLPSPSRLVCAVTLSLGLMGSALPALAFEPAPTPTLMAEPSTSSSAASPDARIQAPATVDAFEPPPANDAQSPAPVQAPSEAPAEAPTEDLSTTPSPLAVPYDELISDTERLAELAGPLGARLGQGADRIAESDDPQIPTREESALLDALAEGLSVDEVEEERKVARSLDATAGRTTESVGPAEGLAATNYWNPSGVLGVDVSSHQGTVDWSAAWAYGSRFAYVKATEGTYYENPFFRRQYDGATNRGMLRGAYHFATPNTTSGAEQARYFVANGGGWSADGRTLPPLLDIEYNPYASLGNACYNMSPSQMVAWIRDFSDTMRALTGRVPMIYSTADWWNGCTGNSTAFTDHPLHIASYNNTGPGALAAGWRSYALWQYTSEGPVVGDWNQWPGDLNGLRAFAGAVPPAPVVAPTDKSLKVFSPGDFTGDRRADMLARRPDGTLWLYPGYGNGSFGAARKIGSGFEVFDQFIATGDYDGDRRNDFLARHGDGSLWRYSGTGTVSGTNEGYRTGVRIGDGGWNAFNTIVGTGDADGNGRSDILARRPDGTLWLYSGPGDGTHGIARQVGTSDSSLDLIPAGDFNGDGPVDLISKSPRGELRLMVGNRSGGFTPIGFTIGSGWDIYTGVIGNQDFNGDGKHDLVAIQPDQTLRFYAGTAQASEGYLRPIQTSTALWSANSTIITTADLNSDKRRDTLTRRPDGSLWFHPGLGRSVFATPRQIGTGWNVYQDITSAGDFNGDRRNDIIARTPEGDLFLYRGTGIVSASNEGYLPRIKIGSGWNMFTDIVASHDLTGDNRPDILARHEDGSLWRYTGTGRVDATSEGYRPGTIIGLSGWDALVDITPIGDFDNDGTTDLITRTPTGELGLYRGNNTSFPTYEVIGTGWNIYTRILALGDQNNDTFADITTTTPAGTTLLYPGDTMRDEGYRSALTTGRL